MARYLNIKLDVFMSMLPGETKEQAEDRLVDLINDDGDALVLGGGQLGCGGG